MGFKIMRFFWAIACILFFSGAVSADDHGNTCSTATLASLNSARTGSIETAGDYDYFRIQVTSSGTLTVYTTGSTDTYGYLKNSGCSTLAYNDDANGTTNFSISRSVTAGTYYVAVRHYSTSGTGSYMLNVGFVGYDDHGNTCSTATSIVLNSSGAGSRSGVLTAGDYDYFRIAVTSSGTLTVYTTGNTDTYGYLKNSGCSNLASDDDSNGSGNFRISRSVTAGTYYVAVRHYSTSGTGAYTLNVRAPVSPPPPSDDGNTCSTATSMSLNSSRTGIIETPGDYDYFQIRVTSSGTLTIYTTGNTDTYGFLKNSGCTTLVADDDANGSGNFRIVRPVTAGTYYVAVKHYSSSGTGAYRLYVSFAPAIVSNPFAANFDVFIQNRNGNSIDMDGYYGAQCVDLMHAYIRDVLKVPYPHGFTGNAYPIYSNAANSTTRVSTEFGNIRLDKIANTPTGVPVKGDIIFWGTGLVPTGHVAIFISGDVNSFTSIDQNWVNSSINGSPAAIVTHNYNHVVGWLHPVDIP